MIMNQINLKFFGTSAVIEMTVENVSPSRKTLIFTTIIIFLSYRQMLTWVDSPLTQWIIFEMSRTYLFSLVSPVGCFSNSVPSHGRLITSGERTKWTRFLFSKVSDSVLSSPFSCQHLFRRLWKAREWKYRRNTHSRQVLQMVSCGASALSVRGMGNSTELERANSPCSTFTWYQDTRCSWSQLNAYGWATLLRRTELWFVALHCY